MNGNEPRRVSGIAAALLAATVLAAAGGARAQMSDDHVAPQRDFESPERLILELRIGPYEPDVGNDSFEQAFPGDDGPMLALELDVVVWRWTDILYLCAGAGVGWAGYTGEALDRSAWKRNESTTTDEETDFDMIPLSLMGVLRVDALARQVGVPFIFTGKLGYRLAIWESETGGVSEADGVSPALIWAAQLAFDLDFFDRRGARQLDEEWGINHTFLFFEVFGAEGHGDGLPLDEITWTAGLGLVT